MGWHVRVGAALASWLAGAGAGAGAGKLEHLTTPQPGRPGTPAAHCSAAPGVLCCAVLCIAVLRCALQVRAPTRGQPLCPSARVRFLDLQHPPLGIKGAAQQPDDLAAAAGGRWAGRHARMCAGPSNGAPMPQCNGLAKMLATLLAWLAWPARLAGRQ